MKELNTQTILSLSQPPPASADELAEFLSRLVLIHVSFYENGRLAGRVIKLSENYITIQKRSGQIQKIRRDEIRAIEVLPEPGRVV